MQTHAAPGAMRAPRRQHWSHPVTNDVRSLRRASPAVCSVAHRSGPVGRSASPASSRGTCPLTDGQPPCVRQRTDDRRSIAPGCAHSPEKSMKPNTLVTLIFAGTALVGGCASADAPYDRYDSRTGSIRQYGSVTAGRDRTKATTASSTRSNRRAAGAATTPSPGRSSAASSAGSSAIRSAAARETPLPPLPERSAAPRSGTRSARAMRARMPIAFASGSTTAIYQTVTQASIGNLRVGDSVRIENGRAYRY